MKINIAFPFKDEPWGGGNQFLKALRSELALRGLYTEDPLASDVILINSHHWQNGKTLKILYKARKRGITIVHRLACPLHLHRNSSAWLDGMIVRVNKLFCQGTIFQSQWSRNQWKKNGHFSQGVETVIFNAPDAATFYPNKTQQKNNRIHLIATSWSGNIRKGFDIYEFLDKDPTAADIDFTFVGNSPVTFTRAKNYPPQSSIGVAELLRANDIFIAANLNDSCSNSVLEALHCGLPVAYRNSGGNPELVGNAGEPFTATENVVQALNKIRANIEEYRRNINVPSLHEVADRYIDFMRQCREESHTQKPEPVSYYSLICLYGMCRAVGKIQNLTKKYSNRGFHAAER